MVYRILLFFLACVPVAGFGQKVWSLKECIDYALNHNIGVQQSVIAAQMAEATRNQNFASFFPSINGSTGVNYNFGRSLDPTSYSYTDKTFQSGSASLNASLPIFQGFGIQNSYKKSISDMNASKQDALKSQNDIALAVATTYLQILYYKEQLQATNDRIDAVTTERNRTRLLVENELLAEGSLLDAEALLSTEEYNKIAAENLLTNSKISLIQLMQLDSVSDIEIEKPIVEIPSSESSVLSADAIYSQALKILPEIKAADFRITSAHHALNIARGGRYPQLSAFGSLSTNFSNQASTLDGAPSFIGYMPTGALTASGEEVFQPVYSYKYKDTPYDKQFSNNFGKSFGISLSIPIFNSWSVNSNIKRSKLSFENAKLNALQVKNETYKTIRTAHADAVAAINKYNAATKTNDAQQKAFTYTEKKYNAGLLNSLDYINARNNLTKAQSDLLQSKYEMILKLKVLDFYLGKPLSF
ncbi:MAG: TolC family protein [Bacteroidetes bacterium]|jgi:outer membrane protein|nr:TolC family protein [Bacteroidota bacterium]